MHTIGRLLLLLAAASAPLAARTYQDPDGVFSLTLPDAWKDARTPLPDVGVLSQFGSGNDALPPANVLVVTSDRPIAAEHLEEAADLLLGYLKQLLAEAGQVTTTPKRAETFRGVPARSSDVAVDGGAAGRWQGLARVLLGQQHVVLLLSLAPTADAALRQQAETVLGQIALPNLSAATGQGPFSPQGLGTLADRVKTGLRPADDTVLAAGEPPLTAGAVAAFVKLLSYLFEVELSETEYQATQDRFVTSYGQADAAGRQVLTSTGQQLLNDLLTGTAAERDQQKQEVKGVFEARLQAGAAAGIPWAAALWEAVTRRRGTVVATQAEPPAKAAGEDREVSEADLDAALEMLYFMWVAAGRDASVVTPEVVAQVRQLLIQAYPRLPAPMQYLLANAEAVYSRVRGAWLQADPQQRAQLAREFGVALDDLGFKDPAAGGGAWGDAGSSNLAGELVVSTCYNLSQRETGGAWPSSPRN